LFSLNVPIPLTRTNAGIPPVLTIQRQPPDILPLPYPTTQPYPNATAIVSAPCRDQPCLTTAPSALFTTDATDSTHNTLTLRSLLPDGACLSLPRESGHDHFNIYPLHNPTLSDTDKDTDRVIPHHPTHLHITNQERPPAPDQITHDPITTHHHRYI
jgi:hypothetical protein